MKNILKWDTNIANDWKWAVPPARPSISELLVFQNSLSAFPKKSSVLILGSTPEFRDLCFERCFDTTVVDYSRNTFTILGEYLRHPDVTRLVVQDWRSMNFEAEFDCVIGDLAINMISLPEQKYVLRNIRNALKVGGFLLHRVWIRSPNKYTQQTTTLEHIVEEHEKERANENYFYSLALPFVNFFFDDQKQQIRLQDMLSGLRKAHSEGKINDECLRAFEGPWQRYFMPNWLQPAPNLESMMADYLTLVTVKHGDDFFNPFSPIYIMQRQS